MHQNLSCQQWGETVTLDADQAKFTADLIDQNYLINWLVDGLPAAEMKIDVADGETFSSVGFELGQVDVPLNRPGAGEDPTKRLVSTDHPGSIRWRLLRFPSGVAPHLATPRRSSTTTTKSTSKLTAQTKVNTSASSVYSSGQHQ